MNIPKTARFALAATCLSMSSLLVVATESADAELEETDQTIEEITIMASRLSLEPLDVETLTLDTFTPAVSWVELINSLRGKAVSQSGNRGALTQIRVRGAEADHLKILFNGVPMNTSTTESHVGAMSPVGINQIEALNGPRSAVWGSAALAGVINFSSKPSSVRPRIYADAGSFGSMGYGVDFGKKLGETTASIHLASRKSDGTNIASVGNEDDGFDQRMAHVGIETQRDDFKLSAFIRNVITDSQYDPIPSDGDRHTLTENLLLGQRLEWRIGDESDILFEASRTATELANHSNHTETNFWSGDLSRLALVGRHRIFENQRASIAIDHVSENFEQRGDVSPYGNPNYIEAMSTTGLSAEYLVEPKAIQLLFSLRTESNSDYGNATTWHTSITKNLEKQALSYSIGVGIKNPSFIERFGFTPDRFLGNPDLKPEKSVEHEIAYTRAAGRSTTTVAVFLNELSDEINGFAWNSEAMQFTAENLTRESKRRGIEIQQSLDLNNAVIDANLAYVKSSEAGEAEIRRPKYLAHIRGRANLTPRLKGLASASYTSSQLDRDFSSFPARIVTLDAYTLVRLGLQYQVTPKTLVYMNTDNTLDTDYENVYGYGTSGRSVNLGIEIQI